MDQVEQFLRLNLLAKPLGMTDIARQDGLEKTRDELAFQAAEMVMFLSPNHSPRGILHMVLSEQKAISSVGCAIQYEEDILLIHARIGDLPGKLGRGSMSLRSAMTGRSPQSALRRYTGASVLRHRRGCAQIEARSDH